jgi:soluble lytic murein transglycosylase-like protein
MIFNMRFHWRAVLLLAGVLLCAPSAPADELHLKDGRVIEAEEIWETGDTLWYRRGKMINSIARADVLRITRPRAAAEAPLAPAANAKPAALSGTVKTESASGSVESVEARKVARIFLKDSTQIDADNVWESETRVGYRLGKMQTFIDRADVERIVHDISIVEQTPVPASPLRYSTGHRGLDYLISQNAEKYRVDPTLIYLIMREESRFNYRAVSHVGARGLMQLMPGTARRLGVINIHDPVQNVEAGTRYLRSLLDMFNGDLNLALAGYNAGENAVLKYGRRVPPYRETMNYVWRINTAYRRSLVEANLQK